MDQTIPWR